MIWERLAAMNSPKDNELPGDWRIVKHVSEFQSCEVIKITVESDFYNTVLEGSWPWIMKKIQAYKVSPKAGL